MKEAVIMKSWSVPATCCTFITLLWQNHSDLQLNEQGAGMSSRRSPLCSWQCSPFFKPLQKQESVYRGRDNALHYLELKHQFELSGLACSWHPTDASKALSLVCRGMSGFGQVHLCFATWVSLSTWSHLGYKWCNSGKSEGGCFAWHGWHNGQVGQGAIPPCFPSYIFFHLEVLT